MASEQRVSISMVPLVDSLGDGIYRVLELSSKTRSICLGRASKSESKNRMPAEDNGWLDSPIISKDHAKIWIEDTGDVYISDIGSTHGTFLNDKMLIKHKPYTLSNDSIVRFGITVVREPDAFPAQSFRIRIQVKEAQYANPTSVYAALFNTDTPFFSLLTPDTNSPASHFSISPNRSFCVPDDSDFSDDEEFVEESVKPEKAVENSGRFSVPESTSDEDSDYLEDSDIKKEPIGSGPAVDPRNIVDMEINESEVKEVIDISDGESDNGSNVDLSAKPQNDGNEDPSSEDSENSWGPVIEESVVQSTGLNNLWNDEPAGTHPLSSDVNPSSPAKDIDEDRVLDSQTKEDIENFSEDAEEYITEPKALSEEILKRIDQFTRRARERLEELPGHAGPSGTSHETVNDSQASAHFQSNEGSTTSEDQAQRASKVSIANLIDPISHVDSNKSSLKRKRSEESSLEQSQDMRADDINYPDAQPRDFVFFADDEVTGSSSSSKQGLRIFRTGGSKDVTKTNSQACAASVRRPAKRARRGSTLLRTAGTALAGAVLGSVGTIWALAQLQERDMASL